MNVQYLQMQGLGYEKLKAKNPSKSVEKHGEILDPSPLHRLSVLPSLTLFGGNPLVDLLLGCSLTSQGRNTYHGGDAIETLHRGPPHPYRQGGRHGHFCPESCRYTQWRSLTSRSAGALIGLHCLRPPGGHGGSVLTSVTCGAELLHELAVGTQHK